MTFCRIMPVAKGLGRYIYYAMVFNKFYSVTLTCDMLAGVWLQCSFSSKLAVLPKLESPAFPTILTIGKKRWVHAFPKSIHAKWMQSQLEFEFILPIPFSKPLTIMLISAANTHTTTHYNFSFESISEIFQLQIRTHS